MKYDVVQCPPGLPVARTDNYEAALIDCARRNASGTRMADGTPLAFVVYEADPGIAGVARVTS